MHDLFRSYYRPTDEEFGEMWREGIFSFDTNVLLNVYRYTPDTRNRLFEILRRFNNRIWIPHQVGYEYHERRLDVISDQYKVAQTIETQLSESFDQIEKELRKYKNHPFANVDQLMQTIKEAVERAKVALQEAESKHPNFIRSDQLLATITDLFNSKVGQPYPEPELERLYKEIDERYEKKTPPGYEDAKDKKDERKYGDAIIWYQLIDYAKAEKKPLIFVTGERKEDWWLRHKGEIIGPRRELIREIHAEAGVLFYMYPTDQFMEQAESFFDLHDHKGAIEEVREIIRQDESNTSKSVASAISTVSMYTSDNEDVQNYESEFRGKIIMSLWEDIFNKILVLYERYQLPKQSSHSLTIKHLGAEGLISVDNLEKIEKIRMSALRVKLNKFQLNEEYYLRISTEALVIIRELDELIKNRPYVIPEDGDLR